MTERGQKTLILKRGDTFSVEFYPPVGNVLLRLESWFTVKKDHADSDSEAMIQIQETTGLEIINGTVAATPANGSIVVRNGTIGFVQVSLAAAETAKLTSETGQWFYNIQILDSGVVATMVRGRFVVENDITLAVARQI